MSDESIKLPSTSNNVFNPLLNYFGTKIRVEFKESCLKQGRILFNHGEIVNISIVYEINKKFNISSYPMLENCLFSAVELQNILILISTNTLDMALDLIEKYFSYLGNW